MQSLIHREEVLQLISQYAIYQYGFPYKHSFMTVIPRQCCKETRIDPLHAEKIFRSSFGKCHY